MIARTLTVLLGLALLLPSSASAAEFSKKALAFDVKVGADDATTCRIVADLYTPAGASKANPVPAVMATNGFGGSKAEFDTLGPSYAKRGYVFLSYSGLGFGGSGCRITLDNPKIDGKAGSQLVSFLGGSKAAVDGTKLDSVIRDAVAHDGSRRADDPRVGMIGGSYGGQIQFAVASVDPRMDTLIPQITWNDLAYSLTPNNTDFERGVTYRTPGVVKLDWPVLFTALGVGTGLQQTIQAQDPSHLGVCPNFDDRVCAALVTSGALGYPTPSTLELLREVSVTSYADRVRIPTFLVQGQSDTLFDLQEAVATYDVLRGRGTPTKMLWRSAGHSGGGLGSRESAAANPERAYESRLALEWFDFYLRGLGDAPALDFGFLRDWALPEGEGDAAPAVGTTPSYPAGQDEALFLSGTNALVSSRGEVKAGAANVLAAPGATGNGGGFTTAPVPDAPGTTATFSTAPVAGDVDVVGIPRLRLKLSAPGYAATRSDPAGKLVLFAKLLDVDPAGGATVLPRSQLSAARVADVTKPFEIQLPGISYRFRKGHQLRLVLATSNSTNRGNVLPGPVTIAADPADPNVLTIPRLGPQAAATATGASGTTPFTPAADAPAPQRAGSGAQPNPDAAGGAAPVLPSARRCVSRRAFTIRLPRGRDGDRVRSAVVRINGKRGRVLRGRRLRARIVLRGLPKGTVRVLITVRTVKGRTLRSARTYRTCVPGKGKGKG